MACWKGLESLGGPLENDAKMKGGENQVIYFYRCSFLTEPPKYVSHSVVSNPLWTSWTLACPLVCPWASPGKNTGVGSHSLLQGIFPTQGSNLQSPALADGFFTL